MKDILEQSAKTWLMVTSIYTTATTKTIQPFERNEGLKWKLRPILRIEFARKCYFLHLLKRRGPKVCGTILGKCSWVAEVAKLFRQFLQWSRLTFFLSWGLTWHARWSLGFFSSRFLWLSGGVSCSSFRERGRASFRLIVGFHLMSAFDVAEQLRF